MEKEFSQGVHVAFNRTDQAAAKQILEYFTLTFQICFK